MNVVYSAEPIPGHKTKHPREFRAPVEGAQNVYIAGDWPVVRRAYEKVKGVKVHDISKLPKAGDAKPMTKG